MSNPLLIDLSLHWLAILIYVAATLANTQGIIFSQVRSERLAYRLLAFGLLIHGLALLYRWWGQGHGPYLVKYEVLSSNAWVALTSFLLFRQRFPQISSASLVVFPSAFLLLAIGLFLDPRAKMLPPTLSTIWLVLHIAFYKIALGTLIIALTFSIFYCLKQKRHALWLDRLPALPTLDTYAFRFAGFGFTFWGIAMLAGSIWAYHSWGRFWGWDPVENWSLLTWMLFGIYLHLRRFFAWHGERAAYFFMLCFVASLLALFGTPAITSSIHTEYFK